MTMRTVGAAVVGALVGALVASAVVAQQPARPLSLTTPQGFVVEEVRVGGSCVVIVSRTEFQTLDTVPCGN